MWTPMTPASKDEQRLIDLPGLFMMSGADRDIGVAEKAGRAMEVSLQVVLFKVRSKPVQNELKTIWSG